MLTTNKTDSKTMRLQKKYVIVTIEEKASQYEF